MRRATLRQIRPILSLQLPQSSFLCVLLNDGRQCCFGNVQILCRDTILFHLLWQQMSSGNFAFFFLGVTGKTDNPPCDPAAEAEWCPAHSL